LIHPGCLAHGGADITFGVRQLLVAFVECDWLGRNDGVYMRIGKYSGEWKKTVNRAAIYLVPYFPLYIA
jgi:hypothetical protein